MLMEKKNYYGVDFEIQRNKILKSKMAQPFVGDVLSRAELALGRTYEALKMSEYMEFCRNGNRVHYETKYFERRNNAFYLMAALWLTKDEKYVESLTDHIFCICDEFSWCLPAHAFMWEKVSVESVIKYVDLFAAETTRLFADIVVAVGELLPYYATERIRYEVNRRVIGGFKERAHFPWEDYRNNWSAVCAAGVLQGVLYFGTEQDIEDTLPRLYQNIEVFLDSYGEDGCCQEGYSYWNYGFGQFVIFARSILEYTNGKVNYFAREKVKRIAAYPQKIRMGRKRNVSFADGGSEFQFSIGLMCYLKELYPQDILLPELCYGTMEGNVRSLTDFLWFNPDYQEDERTFGVHYFEDAKWFIKQSKEFCFAAKAGHNDEPHNHNDLGSFMIVVGDDVPLADLGCAEYTRDTFDVNVRYHMLNYASWGHSVPIIDGHYQCDGKEYRTSEIRVSEDTFSMDISGAYESGVVDKLTRTFEVKEHGVTLKDHFEFSEKTKNIRERFVSWTLPDVSEGVIDLKTARILFDQNRYRVKISKDSYKDHNTLKKVRAYLIDVMPTDKSETEFVFQIEING